MANVYREPNVGDFCYKPFRPSVAGKVVEVINEYHVIVQWIDGSKSEHLCTTLNDFNALIEDHRKKLATHEAMLERLKAL